MTQGWQSHVEILLMGLLIIFFLIVEPHGLARLWQIAKEKLQLWPFRLGSERSGKLLY